MGQVDEPLLIADATVLLASGDAVRRDVRVDGGRVVGLLQGTPHGTSFARRVEARGRLLVPAFRDAHCHLVFGGLLLVRPNLAAARSRREALEVIAASLAAHRGEGALVAEAWDDTHWHDGALDRRDLDALGATVPIVARRACGHVAVVSSRALALVPPGADVDGEAGRLVHDAAMTVERSLPGLEAERARALAAIVRRAYETGVVAVDEPCRLDDLLELRDAARDGRLDLRVRALLRYDDWVALPPERRREVIDPKGAVPVVGLKLFADGTIGSSSAALGEPYAGDGGRGELHLDADAIASAARTAHESALPIGVHAIGDRAVTAALDAIETAGCSGDRIEHAEMIAPSDIPRFARLGVTASMQPNFVARWGGEGGLYERRLGAARARATNRFESLRRSGATIFFGSDSMPMDPVFGLGGALSHPDPGERLSVTEALAAYCVGGSGAIEPGVRADLCLVDADAPARLGDARVVATWSGGRSLHGDEGAA